LHQSIKSPFTVLDNFQRENPNQIFKTQEIAFCFSSTENTRKREHQGEGGEVRKNILREEKKTPMIEALKSNNPTSTIDAVSEF
jgi:hypothetical protein